MAIEGRHELVEDLAIKQGDYLRRFLRRRVRNAADIPDIIQEAFLRLLRVPNQDRIRAPEAYISTIVQHIAQQHALRSAARMELNEMLTDVRASAADPALEVGAEQCLEELDQALSQLPPKVRYTFLSYKRDGLSLDEISARIGISRPTAKKYLAVALIHLRKRLKEME